MSKAIWILGTVGVLAVVTSSVMQHDASRRLAREVALLRDDVRGAVARGGKGSDAVHDESRVGARAALGNGVAAEEIGALRDQVAALRKTAEELTHVVRSAKPGIATPVPPPETGTIGPGNVPARDWKNAGKLTPEATIETVMWSAMGGEVEVLANTIGFTATARTKADAWFAELSPQVREQYGSPEKVIALMIAKDAANVGGMEVLAQRELTTDNVGVRIRVANDQGQTKDQTYLLNRGADGWRLMMTDSVVEKFARQLSAKR